MVNKRLAKKAPKYGGARKKKRGQQKKAIAVGTAADRKYVAAAVKEKNIGTESGGSPAATAGAVRQRIWFPQFEQIDKYKNPEGIQTYTDYLQKMKSGDAWTLFQTPSMQWHCSVYESNPSVETCYLTPVTYMDEFGVDVSIDITKLVFNLLDANNVTDYRSNGPPNPNASLQDACIFSLEHRCANVLLGARNIVGSLTSHFNDPTSQSLPWMEDAKRVVRVFEPTIRRMAALRLVGQSVNATNLRNGDSIMMTNTDKNEFIIGKKMKEKMKKALLRVKVRTKQLLTAYNNVIRNRTMLSSPLIFIQIYKHNARTYNERDVSEDFTNAASSSAAGTFPPQNEEYVLGFLLRQQILMPGLAGFSTRNEYSSFRTAEDTIPLMFSVPELARFRLISTQPATPLIPFSSQLVGNNNNNNVGFGQRIYNAAAQVIGNNLIGSPNNNKLSIAENIRQQVSSIIDVTALIASLLKETSQSEKQIKSSSSVKTNLSPLPDVRSLSKRDATAMMDESRLILASGVRSYMSIPHIQLESQGWQTYVTLITDISAGVNYPYIPYFGVELPDYSFSWGNSILLGKGSYGHVITVRLTDPKKFANTAMMRHLRFVGGFAENRDLYETAAEHPSIVIDESHVAFKNDALGNSGGFNSGGSSNINRMVSFFRRLGLGSNATNNSNVRAVIISDATSAAAQSFLPSQLPYLPPWLAAYEKRLNNQARNRYGVIVPDIDTKYGYTVAEGVAQGKPADILESEVVIALKVMPGRGLESDNKMFSYRRESMFSMMLSILGGLKSNITPCYGWCIKGDFYGLVSKKMPYAMDTLEKMQYKKKSLRFFIQKSSPIFNYPVDTRGTGSAGMLKAYTSIVNKRGTDKYYYVAPLEDTEEISFGPMSPNKMLTLNEMLKYGKNLGVAGGNDNIFNNNNNFRVQAPKRNTIDISPSKIDKIVISDYFAITDELKRMVRINAGPDFEKMKKTPPVTLMDIAKFAIGMFNGLAFMHIHELVHRDVKPANTLVGLDMTAYLTDFGFTVPMGSWELLSGTKYFMTPKFHAVMDSIAIPGSDAGSVNALRDGSVDVFAVGKTLISLIPATLEYDSASLADAVYLTSPNSKFSGGSLGPRLIAFALWTMGARNSYNYNPSAKVDDQMEVSNKFPSAAEARDVAKQIFKEYGGESTRRFVSARIAKIMYIQ